jgi:hypothetical protein
MYLRPNNCFHKFYGIKNPSPEKCQFSSYLVVALTHWYVCTNLDIYVLSWREQVNFQWGDDEVRFVLDQHTELDFLSASSLKQQSVDSHVAPLRHIILIVLLYIPKPTSYPSVENCHLKIKTNILCNGQYIITINSLWG